MPQTDEVGNEWPVTAATNKCAEEGREVTAGGVTLKKCLESHDVTGVGVLRATEVAIDEGTIA
jgi:hypothetical protein